MFLLNVGVDLDVKSYFSKFFMFFIVVVRLGYVKVVKLLLLYNVIVYLVDGYVMILLMYVVREDYGEIVNLLLKCMVCDDLRSLGDIWEDVMLFFRMEENDLY